MTDRFAIIIEHIFVIGEKGTGKGKGDVLLHECH